VQVSHARPCHCQPCAANNAGRRQQRGRPWQQQRWVSERVPAGGCAAGAAGQCVLPAAAAAQAVQARHHRQQQQQWQRRLQQLIGAQRQGPALPGCGGVGGERCTATRTLPVSGTSRLAPAAVHDAPPVCSAHGALARLPGRGGASAVAFITTTTTSSSSSSSTSSSGSQWLVSGNTAPARAPAAQASEHRQAGAAGTSPACQPHTPAPEQHHQQLQPQHALCVPLAKELQCWQA
jgi:hypothetical protein